MANFAVALTNPYDEPTRDELVQTLSDIGISQERLEALTQWQLQDLIADWRF